MAEPTGKRLSKSIEDVFERGLWGARLVVLVAVVASLAGAVVVLAVATLDAIRLVETFPSYIGAHDRDPIRTHIVGYVIEMLDGYLLSTVLLVFAFGLYELFISRINGAENSELGTRLLLIRDLDDLKDRLAKVILLILVVTFFKHSVALTYTQPVELLYLAAGIVLVAGALYLAHRRESGSHKSKGSGPGH